MGARGGGGGEHDGPFDLVVAVEWLRLFQLAEF